MSDVQGISHSYIHTERPDTRDSQPTLSQYNVTFHLTRIHEVSSCRIPCIDDIAQSHISTSYF